ncbi:MAG: glycine betaine/L-proline ABC transporter ATP-binding protein ProV [Desulfohalobiaceae bacterium]
MSENHEKLVVKDLFKIFGPNPQRAYPLIEQGKSKDEVFDETGLTIGVQNANFSVYQGEIFVVMGLSGSGKSTLVRMLNRLIEPTSGQVYIDERDVASLSKEELIKLRRRDMSMVFQSFALLPHLTVLQNASFGLEVAGYPEQEQRKRGLEALEMVGLKANAHSYPSELSGGMQQRVGLARGLAVDPSIMLMDEAFSALDPLIRTEMQDELLKIQSESQRTVVFISHDLDEAMRIGDRIAMMEGGRIVQVGSPEEILKYPADEYVRAFFRGVDPTNVLSAGDIVRDNQVTIIQRKGGAGLRAALERLMDQDRPYGYVLDQQHKLLGVVSIDSLRQAIDSGNGQELQNAFVSDLQFVNTQTPLQEVLPAITETDYPVPVVDDKHIYQGAISKNRFLKTLKREG